MKGETRRSSIVRRMRQISPICSNVPQAATSSVVCSGSSTCSHSAVAASAKAKPAVPTAKAPRKAPSQTKPRIWRLMPATESSALERWTRSARIDGRCPGTAGGAPKREYHGCLYRRGGGHTRSPERSRPGTGGKMRRVTVATALAAALMLGAAPTTAQQYPAHPITLIVPFTAGGPTDVLARVLGQHMSQTLGQQIVIENVTGAGGTLGSVRVARAAPDGYTLVMGNIGTHAASVGLYKNLAYDPSADFAPIMVIATTPMVLVARKALPADQLADFGAP